MVKSVPYLLAKNGKKAIKLYEDIFDAKLVDHQPFSKEMGAQMDFPADFNYEGKNEGGKKVVGRH